MKFGNEEAIVFTVAFGSPLNDSRGTINAG
jgi:hypothetical protein